MAGGEAVIVAGIGCRSGCPAGDLAAVVRLASATTGRMVGTLAAPAFKQHEPGLHEAARLLDLPLVFVDMAALRSVQPRCPTRSILAERTTGVASVAEGAALAASGGWLLLARISLGGATCALAGP